MSNSEPESRTQSRTLRATAAGLELNRPAGLELADLGCAEIEAEVRAFEEAERRRLGLEPERPEQWVDPQPASFTGGQRAHTTILMGGLTAAQDVLVQAGLAGLGYRAQALHVPDVTALHVGKEFGNRGQCNPTHFTVGNLLKHLLELRDDRGLSTEQIERDYLFLTAGSCGPCRFGTYVTEYRKALRDAGFENFRVLLFQQQGGLKQATGGSDPGLAMNPAFFLTMLKAIMAGDVLNAIGYRIRPYEVCEGATDAALAECKRMLCTAFESRRSVLLALRRCRRLLATVEVDRLQPKPKASVIGEFWAMTTEGDGNYQLQRFLESEGAEVEIQPVSAWLLYNVWQHRWDTRRRLHLRGVDGGKHGLENRDTRRKLALLAMAEAALRSAFKTFSWAVGLRRYSLPDMDEIATISHAYYRNELRGGEGHMEVGKLIQAVVGEKAHMVVSVKPFGCMPSSAVSDGVQSLIVQRHPGAIFCPIETSGDGATSVLSRVQMSLFKARKKARAEFEGALAELGLSVEQARRRSGHRNANALHHPPHSVAGTAANLVRAL